MVMISFGCSLPPVTVPAGIRLTQRDEGVGASLGDGAVVGLAWLSGEVVEGVEELAVFQHRQHDRGRDQPVVGGAGDDGTLRPDPFGLIDRIGMRPPPVVGGLSGVLRCRTGRPCRGVVVGGGSEPEPRRP